MSNLSTFKADSVKGTLVSQLNHPVTMSYKGESLVMAPRQVVKGVDKARLGSLPRGVTFSFRSK